MKVASSYIGEIIETENDGVTKSFKLDLPANDPTPANTRKRWLPVPARCWP